MKTLQGVAGVVLHTIFVVSFFSVMVAGVFSILDWLIIQIGGAYTAIIVTTGIISFVYTYFAIMFTERAR